MSISRVVLIPSASAIPGQSLFPVAGPSPAAIISSISNTHYSGKIIDHKYKEAPERISIEMGWRLLTDRLLSEATNISSPAVPILIRLRKHFEKV